MIKLDRSILRAWKIEDAGSLARHANNPNVAASLRDGFPHPYSYEDAIWWIEKISANKNDIIMAIEIDGEAVGGIGVHMKDDVYRLNGEIGYWLSEEYWGRGIVTEAVNALVEYTFANTDLIRIYACIFENNPASARVLEKCGFRREALLQFAVVKNGVIMGEMVYSRLR